MVMATAGHKERERKADAITLICECLADGKRHSEISPLLATYDVDERTKRRWFEEAEGRYGSDVRKLQDRYRGKVLAGYLHIIERAISGVPTRVGRGENATVEDVPDLMLAKATYDSLCKMLGLNAPAQLDVTHSTEERTLREKDTHTLQERLNLLRTNGGERAN